MSNIVNPTIFAEATGPVKAGVSILRLSGPKAKAAVQDRAGPLSDPRVMALRTLRSVDGTVIDSGLVVWFPAGQSFTGEDVVELHLHGSRGVVRRMLSELADDNRLSLAEPGEFTRRALENERLDLTQVEALADLIDAETERQREQAVAQYSGAIRAVAEAWRKSLVRAVALVEATIDFADEEVPEDVTPEVLELVRSVKSAIDTEIGAFGAAEQVREGFVVAIVGEPNAGKSTLLNALAGREAALTSEIAGTTRDVIEVRMDIGGLPVLLLDTAGLREAVDAVERLGINLARTRAKDADLRVVLLGDAAEAPPDIVQPDDIVAYSKADLQSRAGFGVSGKTGAGLDELTRRIGAVLGSRTLNSGILTRKRHRQAVNAASCALGDVETGLAGGAPQEIVAANLWHAIRALDSLVGRVDVEHVLDEIFSSFCLGK